MARKLKKLRITEISSCDVGAGVGCRIVLAKRDPGAPVRFTKDGRHWDVPGDLSILDHLITHANELGLNIEGAARSTPVEKTVNHFMGTVMEQPIAKMYARAAEIMKADDKLSHDQAIAKIATSSRKEDQILWKAYKETATVPPPAAAPAPTATSPAYEKLMKRARKLARREGLSEAQAFSRIYSDPANAELVGAEKAEFFAKAAPRRPSDTAFENLVAAILAMHPGLTEAKAREWARATQAHRPPDVARLADYPL
jgi:hypothetical protein